MRLLLDTHTLYWYTTGDPKLSMQAQAVIQDATNDVFLSPASLWEIAVKVSTGKWQMNQTFEVFLDSCLNQYEFRILPIEPSHTIAVSRLPFPTEHPPDSNHQHCFRVCSVFSGSKNESRGSHTRRTTCR